nr:hypothetical protein [Pseudomonas sp. HS-2]
MNSIPAPVSYTHLDVYKRLVPEGGSLNNRSNTISPLAPLGRGLGLSLIHI